MKQFRLKVPFAGKQEGHIFDSFADQTFIRWQWSGANIELKLTESELVEEVKEDYKILSFKAHDTIEYFLNQKYIPIIKDYSTWVKFMMESASNWNIHSVVRLSDSEVFTIGDNIYEDQQLNWRADIVSIYLRENKIYLNTCTENKSRGRFLNETNKTKQKLFTTEDGVDIFRTGHTVWYIDERFHYELKACSLQYYFDRLKDDYLNYKVFSTKEKAEEYIILNKPCLSLKDVKDWLKSTYDSFGGLENLIKQKLKL